jgi:hypothetical protein
MWIWLEREDRAQFVRCDGAQRMGSDADPGIVERGDRGAAVGEETRVAVDRVDEAALPVRWRSAAKTGMGVEDGQQGEADAAVLGRLRYRDGHGGGIGIGGAIGLMVEIMKFGDAGEAAFQHLHLGDGGDGADVVGRQRGDHRIHGFAPCPETVSRCACAFGKARHGALEGVTVGVGEAGKAGCMALVVRLRCAVRLDARNDAVLHGEADMARPAGGQQGLFEPDGCHAQLPISAGQ